MNPDTETLYAQVPEREHNIFRNPCPVCDERSTRACAYCDRDHCANHLFNLEGKDYCSACYDFVSTELWLAEVGGKVGNA